MAHYSRRRFLRSAAHTGVYLQSGWLLACSGGSSSSTGGEPEAGVPPGPEPAACTTGMRSNIAQLGPLGEPDEFGVRVPPGFTVRRVAAEGVPPIAGQDFIWHEKPDGGACFAAPDGGWVYVSNSEKNDINNAAGVGALRFNADGELVDAYPILVGSTKNCAGGATPWGTWLSCEETDSGYVYECFPLGTADEAVKLPALGKFQHEACAVDTQSDPMHIYMTEDQRNDAFVNGGGFYRFIPDFNTRDGSRPDLSSGQLQIAVVESGDLFEPRAVSWQEVPNPEPIDLQPHESVLLATRFQVPRAEHFDGGEGIWFHSADRSIVFSTKGDNRLWRYDIEASTVQAIYDDDSSEDNILSALDNVIMTPQGDIICCEDGDDAQVVAITPDGRQVPLLQLIANGEPAGPSFSPDGQRLYISGYSGPSGPDDTRQLGATYEISGPWFVCDTD